MKCGENGVDAGNTYIKVTDSAKHFTHIYHNSFDFGDWASDCDCELKTAGLFSEAMSRNKAVEEATKARKLQIVLVWLVPAQR
jgi:hypothetical protein